MVRNDNDRSILIDFSAGTVPKKYKVPYVKSKISTGEPDEGPMEEEDDISKLCIFSSHGFCVFL